jgi:hypothetical protein
MADKSYSVEDMYVRMRDAEARAIKLEEELIILTKICEDVLGERTGRIPGDNLTELACAIASHSGDVSRVTFIDALIAEISTQHKTGVLSRQSIEIIGLCLEKVGYVDVQWYLENNPDVKECEFAAGTHYIDWGHKEGRKPNRFR